jgi:glycosyltransferase involved in cell wall biosynthesis
VKKERKKILHVIDSLRTGGAETLVLNTIRELTEYVHVVVALNKPEDLKDNLPPGTKYYRLKFDYRWTVIGTTFRLKKIIRSEKPDIIHAHLFWSTIVARLAAGKTAKFIFTLHGMMGLRLFKRKVGFYRFLEKFTISPSQHMVAVSKTVYDDYTRYIPFKGTPHILYNYVPDEYFMNGKKDFTAGKIFRVVTVGSLRALKNHETLVKAIALLGTDYSLDIYGYGEMEKKLKKMALELNANVVLKGSQKDMYKILPGYDLFVMTSFTEGHSIALLEAMALQLPLVLSDISSFKETTQEKSIFYKVDDEKELAAKIRMMKENEALRKTIAESCHAVALQEATRETYLANIRQLYEEPGGAMKKDKESQP